MRWELGTRFWSAPLNKSVRGRQKENMRNRAGEGHGRGGEVVVSLAETDLSAEVFARWFEVQIRFSSSASPPLHPPPWCGTLRGFFSVHLFTCCFELRACTLENWKGILAGVHLSDSAHRRKFLAVILGARPFLFWQRSVWFPSRPPYLVNPSVSALRLPALSIERRVFFSILCVYLQYVFPTFFDIFTRLSCLSFEGNTIFVYIYSQVLMELPSVIHTYEWMCL